MSSTRIVAGPALVVAVAVSITAAPALAQPLGVPTRPTDVVAKRVKPTKGRLTFTPAEPRGAKITGYQGRCVAPNRAPTIAGGSASGVTVSLLAAHVTYTCQVRARSTDGNGPWSRKVTLAPAS